MIALLGWIEAGMLALVALVQWRHRLGREESVCRACHELRGPLTAARLGLELGRREGRLSADRLAAIDLELGRMTVALSDLGPQAAGHGLSACLQVSTRWLHRRSGFGAVAAPAADPVNLAAIAGASVEAWSPVAGATGATLQLRTESHIAAIAADPRRLAQAIGNLVANAIEHGGRTIVVCVSGDAHAGRVEVLDDGPGLPAPIAELIQRARGGRGSRGRGLAIAAAVASSYGGRLSAAPTRRGARVVLELPVVSEAKVDRSTTWTAAVR